MLSWIASVVSSKNATVEVKGSLIEVDEGKKPKTVIVNGTAIIDKKKGPSEFEHVLQVQDHKYTYEWALDEAMEFSQIIETGDEIAFGWRDSEDFNKWFIFRLTQDESIQSNSELFKSLAVMCIYEDKTRTSAAKVDLKKMEEEIITELELDFDITTMEPKKSAKPAKKISKPEAASSLPAISYFDNEAEIARATVDLFMLDPNSQVFVCRASNVVASLVRIGHAKQFTYFMNIDRNDERIFQQQIKTLSSMQFFEEFKSVVWSRYDPTLSTWSIVFTSGETDFKRCLAMARYETLNQSEWEKMKEEDKNMIVQSYQVGIISEDEDQDMADDYMSFDISPEKYDSDDQESDNESEDDDDQYEGASSSNAASRRDKNRFLVDSGRHKRSFVVRGNNIGVFARDDDDVNYDTGILSLKNESGQDLRPSHMMLHKGERNLLLLHENQNDKSHKGRVYQLDIEREKIVNEWTAFDDLVPVLRTAPVYKYANNDDTQQVFGVLNSNALFGMDPRMSEKNKVVGDLNSFTHVSKPDFSCVSTSKNGYVAIGSDKGEIRMLTGVPGLPKMNTRGNNPKTAKTLLPGFGDPIKGIDVTGDGNWILATCKNYLLLVDTTMPTDRSKTGFTERMGVHKPSPRRLQLLPEDLAKLGKEVNFSPAQFNTGSDGETWIVTSSGPYIVTWNFRKAKLNNLTAYTMKKVENMVVDESFLNMGESTPGRDAAIVVVMPDDVKLEKRKRVKSNPFRRMPRKYGG